MALWNQVGSPERVCLEVFAGELAEKMTWLLRSQHHWLEGYLIRKEEGKGYIYYMQG
ncbi:hypothetical protein Hanom_Chr08g00755831 [Helianthus anomalus]